MRSPVKTKQQPIDERPFRSKADHIREQALETQYRRIAIRCVAAAVQQQGGGQSATPGDTEQMH